MQSTGERGEFFHPSLSPFGYNETIAQEYYPLEKDNALQRGLKREDLEYPINIPEGMQTINATDLPPINEANDTILNQAILCSISSKPFRIMKLELDFYRKYKLPLPTIHPEIRHHHRTLLRPEKVLHMRSCDQCQIPITSVYSSAYPTPIYCENCYNKIIY
jgi:hypothetical protein